MGVKGLKSYIENGGDVLKPRRFRNSLLVIDGSNLYYNLYFRTGLDQAHGGEYRAFEKEVSKFFNNLKLCEIKPYVVLDGGDDISNKKFETLKSRAEDRIKRTDALSRGRSGECLPILIKNVFKQLLRKLDVPLIQCIAEADWEIAALANEWECSVLSNDSDFYIFDLKKGFLPLSEFEWRRVRTIKKTGERFIQTKCFNVSRLCTKMNHMKKNLLPIFATLLGNDYANLKKTILPNWTKFALCPGGTGRIDGLLRWLSGFRSPQDAIRALLIQIKDPEDSITVSQALNQGLKEYKLTPSTIAKFFMSGDPQSKLPKPLQNLPQWFLKGIAEGKLNSILLDVLTLHRVTLNCSVQDFRRSSSNLTSRPIRQVFYGIMLAPNPQNARRAPARPRFEVEEYDREGLRLDSSTVVANLPSQITPDLHLDTLLEVPHHVRLQVFLDALRISQAPDHLHIPPGLQLALYVTCYWIKHAEPEPKPEFFGALLVGLVYGELSRDPVTEKVVTSGLKRLKNFKSQKEKTRLDLGVAHAYSQWQCIMRDSICLNQLLDNPVPEPEYTWLYSGVFLYSVVQELCRGITPDSLLAGAPDAVNLYHNLRNAVEQQLSEEVIQRLGVVVKQVQPSKRPVHHDPMDDLAKGYERLLLEEEEEDEDLQIKGKKGKDGNPGDEIYDQTCTSRTRHRKRSGTKDPKSKKYERVWV
ncbi:protein asteroid homolog 1-like [Astyanax mexicanus]|uniref:protein asteroid homolog 1 n=1 Tax=Astyanax mexicanus TaxID=7994 RepID=UPI0020CB2DC4|nr:protein asteroid homolog 1 [Astyanax mexicanus]XP_049324564.1 protein asteroid homolog 1-like [Astyanax mexicanus]XP_049324572.1 protein asteroid homolog 1-like [Astyanax mexicanus]